MKFQSVEYWERRYTNGGSSGSGSYNHLAEFKAEIINALFLEFNLSNVLEFGCGDGNQLSLLKCKNYIGLDVSSAAIQRCAKKFEDDSFKSFFLYDYRCFVDKNGIFLSDCAMSLDVLYHLVEQDVYESYLCHLFSCSSKVVIIYAANLNLKQISSHELYRKFTDDIEVMFPAWRLERFVKNRFPAKNYEDQEGSLADFYIYTPK